MRRRTSLRGRRAQSAEFSSRAEVHGLRGDPAHSRTASKRIAVPRDGCVAGLDFMRSLESFVPYVTDLCGRAEQAASELSTIAAFR